jgi:hypothetical protein
MKPHDHKRFAFSAAVAMGVAYLISTIFVMVLPKQALKLTADLLHLSTLEPLAPVVHVTPMGFICGLITVLAYTFFVAWLTGHILCLFYRDQK